MPIQIQIPRLGWSMEEGTFTGWLKKNGELVKTGEPLFVLEGEKATQDVEATENGILQIAENGPKPGTVVKVGEVIGHLLQDSESSGSADTPSFAGRTSALQDPAASSAVPNAESIVSERAKILRHIEPTRDAVEQAISPRARRRAAQLGIDTSGLKGRGRTGRVAEADVIRAANAKSSLTLSTMRRRIAQRTSASFSSIPHFYLRAEVDVSALNQLRQELLRGIETTTGVRLSLTDLILRAQARALRLFPAANAIWVDGDVVKILSCDVGLVVALPEGLMIPILRSADAGDLACLASQRAAQVESVRAGKLTLEELQGGATSLSNLGNTRVDEFAAIISPPHSTILAVGRAALRPFVVSGKLEARSTLRLCLSVDHRVLDGAPAAEFLGVICELLENPSKLV